jgi:signal transduction histidine kinase
MAAPHASSAQLRRLLDAVMAVAYELDLSVLLRHVAEAARDLVGARYAAVGVLDPGGAFLAEFVTVGIDDDERSRIGDPPKGHGVLGLLIAEPRAIRLPDIRDHPDSFGFPVGHPPMTTFLGVPLFVHGRVFGNLSLTDKENDEAFSDVDEELVTGLAAAAALAIENARLHQRASELEVLEDRERIARDLHDRVLQDLFAIGLGIQGTARRTEDEALAVRLGGHVEDIDRTIREIRSVIFGFGSGWGPRGQVREWVLDVVAEAARALGSTPVLRIDGPIDTAVADGPAGELLAVMREALSNVARHAGATHVAVRIIVGEMHLLLEVTDDGCGMPAEMRGGNGVRNMETRAARLGGSVAFEPAAAGGTTMHWSVPLPH